MAGITVGIIGGGGWIGRALAEGILADEIVSPGKLIVSGRRGRPADLSASVRYTADNAQLVCESELVILSVRPEQFLAIAVEAPNRLLVSVMAGVPARVLARKMNTQRVIRAMPSAAASIGRSYTPIFASPGVSSEEKLLVRRIFDAVGRSIEVHSEAHLDYMTGLTGSGPAFVALLANAMLSHAVSRGLDHQMTYEAVRTTIEAAGELVGRGERSAREIIDSLASYRGTTAAALEAMEAAGFGSAVEAGLAAAERRVQTMYPVDGHTRE